MTLETNSSDTFRHAGQQSGPSSTLGLIFIRFLEFVYYLVFNQAITMLCSVKRQQNTTSAFFDASRRGNYAKFLYAELSSRQRSTDFRRLKS